MFSYTFFLVFVKHYIWCFQPVSTAPEKILEPGISFTKTPPEVSSWYACNSRKRRKTQEKWQEKWWGMSATLCYYALCVAIFLFLAGISLDPKCEW